MPAIFRSHTFVLSAIYASMFLVSIIVVLGILYFFSFQFLREQIDQQIEEDVSSILAGIELPIPLFAVDDIAVYLNNRRKIHLRSDPSVYLLVNQDRIRIEGNLNEWPRSFSRIDGNRVEFTAQAFDEQDRVYDRPIRAVVISLGNTGTSLLVGRDLKHIETLQNGYLRLIFWSLVATLVLAVFGAYWVSRIVSRRLESVNATSRAVMQGDLTKRVKTDDSGDQFADLADNINQMLDRIQSLVEAVRNVSTNIAHDLRTPLTRLRNDLDELARDLDKRQNSDLQDVSEAVDKAISEADSLCEIFDALLRIARLENRPYGDSFSEVSVEPLISDLVELYAPTAEDKAIDLTFAVNPSSATIVVDQQALAQAMDNLLHNALKFTPEGGKIEIAAGQSDGQFEISIADTGPGIPSEHHEEVLKRFVRLDSSRSTPGNGLGLSLVSAVARLHNLELILEDSEPGLKVRLKNFRISHS